MSDGSKALLAAALAGGYLLGRTKKARFALTVASYLAGRQFGLSPRQLVTEGVRKLGEIPQVAELGDQLRGEVLDAGRKALTAAANQQLETLADTLHDRTLKLESGEEEPAEEEEEEEEEEEPYDEGEEPAEDEAAEKAPAKKSAPAKKTAAKKTAAKKTAAKKTTAKKSAPAKKTAAKKKTGKTAKKAPPKKTAAGRKSGSAAKKSAKKTSSRVERRR
ncbi:histone protein [Streptomyces sioyaensis]|uniref:histone protein n=1 Tax=Streptomyces sioyaensis TaxID=67364 RepID=UPI001F2E1EC6|nr:histone protein [Streptomyces sioyaensis]MCF3173292.1 histone protein [Streptomyces sioyaensis]